jgi:broad specificity phosphatase PhoE
MASPGTWSGFALLVRHGVTWWDSAGRGERVEGGQQPSERVTGWLDLPLRHEGVQEVLKTAQALKDYPIELIVTSPLSRAFVTAQAVQRLHPQVKLQGDPHLAAWNTGIYSGQLAKDVKPELDQAVKNPNHPVPRGETFGQFTERYLPMAVKYLNDPRLICIVTHGMNVDLLLHYKHTGETTFREYGGGSNAAIQPGEAIFFTPGGTEELVA